MASRLLHRSDPFLLVCQSRLGMRMVLEIMRAKITAVIKFIIIITLHMILRKFYSFDHFGGLLL